MTLGEVIEKIKQSAIGGAVENSPLNNAEIISELLLPRVIDVVTADAAKDELQLNALRQDHSISFTSGVGALPTTIKEEFADSLYIPSDPSASFKPRYTDYADGGHSSFPSFTVKNGNIYYRGGGQPHTGFTGSLTFNAITFPSLPAALTDTVNIKANLLEQMITLAASIVRQETPLSYIGLDYSNIPIPKKTN